MTAPRSVPMASGFRPLNADGDAGTPTDSRRGRPRRPYPRKTYHHPIIKAQRQSARSLGSCPDRLENEGANPHTGIEFTQTFPTLLVKALIYKIVK